MDHFPVFLALKNRRVLLIGGNPLAARKAALLAKSEASILVIADQFSDAMRALAQENSTITLHLGPFSSDQLDGTSLVLAATDDQSLNQRVYHAANTRGIPVNIADQPELCSYILPAIVDRAPVIVAVSTGGRSPVLARYVKALLERSLPQTLGAFALLLKRWRQPVKDALPNETQRRRFWEHAIDGEIGECALTGDLQNAQTLLQRQLAKPQQPKKTGNLVLVGLPEADIELLSLKAHRYIRSAEWIFYDNNTPKAALELCRREANVINLENGFDAQKMLEKVNLGHRVTRLYSYQQHHHEIEADYLIAKNSGVDAIVFASENPTLTFQASVSNATPAAHLPH